MANITLVGWKSNRNFWQILDEEGNVGHGPLANIYTSWLSILAVTYIYNKNTWLWAGRPSECGTGRKWLRRTSQLWAEENGWSSGGTGRMYIQESWDQIQILFPSWEISGMRRFQSCHLDPFLESPQKYNYLHARLSREGCSLVFLRQLSSILSGHFISDYQ